MSPKIALIDESQCIGCTKCIQACPVDAIFGAAKFMHTVIAAECISCELCVPVCPVDCISMIESPVSLDKAERLIRAKNTKQRVTNRKLRLQKSNLAPLNQASQNKQALIAAALIRAKNKL